MNRLPDGPHPTERSAKSRGGKVRFDLNNTQGRRSLHFLWQLNVHINGNASRLPRIRSRVANPFHSQGLSSSPQTDARVAAVLSQSGP